MIHHSKRHWDISTLKGQLLHGMQIRHGTVETVNVRRHKSVGMLRSGPFQTIYISCHKTQILMIWAFIRSFIITRYMQVHKIHVENLNIKISTKKCFIRSQADVYDRPFLDMWPQGKCCAQFSIHYCTIQYSDSDNIVHFKMATTVIGGVLM